LERGEDTQACEFAIARESGAMVPLKPAAGGLNNKKADL
jgi:hypothetical protein